MPLLPSRQSSRKISVLHHMCCHQECSTSDSPGYERDARPHSLRGMVICEISTLTQSVTFRSIQKNLSIYFVVSLQSTTFASVEIRKLGKMSLLTSVNPLHGDYYRQRASWQGRPLQPPEGLHPPRLTPSPPARQPCCRRLVH